MSVSLCNPKSAVQICKRTARLWTKAYGISLVKALNAAAKVSVLVSMEAPRPSIATAPRGSGVVMMPTIVPTKIASRCQA